MEVPLSMYQCSMLTLTESSMYCVEDPSVLTSCTQPGGCSSFFDLQICFDEKQSKSIKIINIEKTHSHTPTNSNQLANLDIHSIEEAV